MSGAGTTWLSAPASARTYSWRSASIGARLAARRAGHSPCHESLRLTTVLDTLQGLGERVLADVLGVRRHADPCERHRVRGLQMPADQETECLGVALAGAADE